MILGQIISKKRRLKCGFINLFDAFWIREISSICLMNVWEGEQNTSPHGLAINHTFNAHESVM